MAGAQKIPVKKPHKSKVLVSKKREDIKLLVMYSKIPQTQIPHQMTTSQLNFNKTQIISFRKTVDNCRRNLRTGSSKKFNKSELK